MVLNLTPEVETALNEQARRRGVAPEELALNLLGEQLLRVKWPFEPQDEWERGLLAIGIPCGISLSDDALSSDGLYD